MCVSQRWFMSSGVLQYPGVDLTISNDIAILNAMLVRLRAKLLARQWQAIYQSRTTKNFPSGATETEMDETPLLGRCATDFPCFRSRQNLLQPWILDDEQILSCPLPATASPRPLFCHAFLNVTHISLFATRAGISQSSPFCHARRHFQYFLFCYARQHFQHFLFCHAHSHFQHFRGYLHLI